MSGARNARLTQQKETLFGVATDHRELGAKSPTLGSTTHGCVQDEGLGKAPRRLLSPPSPFEQSLRPQQHLKLVLSPAL
eukprot:2085138-Amphidinium_carterae.1